MFGQKSISVLSFLAMIGVWGFLFHSYVFALAFLVMLGVHEMGHYGAARLQGLEVGTPVFTPIGAVIIMRNLPESAKKEAVFAYAGPFFGTLAAIAGTVVGVHFNSPAVVQASYLAYFLNLFNLIPLAPMDGGRISMAISRKLWMLGAVVFLGFMAISFRPNPMVVVIGLLIGWQAILDIRIRQKIVSVAPEYFQVGAAFRIATIVAYLGLAAFLLFALSHFAAIITFIATHVGILIR